MSKQHARIDLETALDMYDRRALTAKGLVEIYFRRSIIPSTIFIKSDEEIYTLLGLSERTYYRALAELRTEEVLFHRTPGKAKRQFALEPETLYEQKKGKRRSTATSERIPDKLGSLPDKLGSLPDRVGSDTCQTWQSELTDLAVVPDKLVSETPLKPLQIKAPAPSSSLLQLSYNSSSSINQANPDDDDDDDDVFIDVKAEEVSKPAYDYRVEISKLENDLKLLSDDRQEWIEFFRWAEEDLWPSFEEPVKHQVRWLKSKDEDDMTRLEINWINFKQHQRTGNAPKKRSAAQEWQKVLGMSARLEFRQRTDQVINPQENPQLFQTVMAIGGLGKIAALENPVELSKLKAAFIDQFNSYTA